MATGQGEVLGVLGGGGGGGGGSFPPGPDGDGEGEVERRASSADDEEAGSGEKARLAVGAARSGARRAEESRWADGRNLAAAKAVGTAMATGQGEVLGVLGGGGSGDAADSGGDGDGGRGGILGMFLAGWAARVAADPQFPFKVLMEELVGVTACVLGDMASRPNFGLNELDFVFSTLVVGSILNFVLMYMLAPTAGVSAAASAAVSSLPSHMFEPGAYSLGSRFATLVSKGTTFAVVGFGAGLMGTAISNGLIAMRKRMDPAFETPNKAPPTLLNAGTWALHMGVSSNLRYQTLNGIEYLLGNVAPAPVFKVSVIALRCMNNVLGGMSFVLLARLTGAQKSDKPAASASEAKERLIAEGDAIAANVSSEDK